MRSTRNVGEAFLNLGPVMVTRHGEKEIRRAALDNDGHAVEVTLVKVGLHKLFVYF